MSAITEEGVTTTIMVATQLQRILDAPRFDPERFASMRLLLYGASPTRSDLVERMVASLSCGLYHGYGLTEATTVCTALGPEEHRRGTGTDRSGLSCGRPIVGVDVKVKGPDGGEARPGEVGELLIRTPKLMSGYWRQPESHRPGHPPGLAPHRRSGVSRPARVPLPGRKDQRTDHQRWREHLSLPDRRGALPSSRGGGGGSDRPPRPTVGRGGDRGGGTPVRNLPPPWRSWPNGWVAGWPPT